MGLRDSFRLATKYRLPILRIFTYIVHFVRFSCPQRSCEYPFGPGGAMARVHEVLIIGSGFGGSVAAARLAEAGVDVALLERGPWRDTLPVQSMGIPNRIRYPA